MKLPTGKRHKRSNKGFTLTELLLSVVILSFGLVAIIGTYLTAANALDHSQNRLEAVAFLQDKLVTLNQDIMEQQFPEAVSESVLLNHRPATYILDISALAVTDKPDLSDKLDLAKLSLAWKERNIDKDVSVFTYLEKKPPTTHQ
jgi:prepilin-type N-terminal cleavage/methylation domain-containing protein